MVWVHGEEDRLMASIVDAPSRPVAPKHYWTIERSRDFRKRNGSKTRCFSSFSDHFGGVHRDVEKRYDSQQSPDGAQQTLFQTLGL